MYKLSILPLFLVFIFLFPLAVQAQSTMHQVSLKPENKAIDKLSGAIKYKTVSSLQKEEFRYKEFLAFHKYLEDSFPVLHQSLNREVINEYSLLYTWAGSNTELKPVMLSAHMDVVPVEKATIDSWEEDPFGGIIRDGFVWGRGTMDDKYRVVATMEAVEQLLQAGYKPERTLYLAFGHDEEVGGEEGARMISAYLAEQGIKLEAVFDEGLAIAEDVLPSLQGPLALVGTAAKGNLNLKLTVDGKGGHSSAPPKDTPIDILSKALAKLHANPFPARMTPTTRETVTVLADKLGGKYKFAIRNYGLFKGRIIKMLAKDRATDALIRTIMVPTVLEAGEKYNVLPRVASAVINVRILTGENDKTVTRRIRKIINDERVSIEVHGVYTPPSPVTETDTWVFDALKVSIVKNFDNVLVVPTLFPGSTDAKHYTNLTSNIFRFAPQVVNRESAQLIHNVDERLAIDVYVRSIAFYNSLIQSTCGKSDAQNVVSDDEISFPDGVPGN